MEEQVENDAKQVVDVEAIDVEEPRNLFTEMMNHKMSYPKPKGRRSMSDAVISPPEIITNRIKKFPITTKKFHCPSPQTESKPRETRPVKKSDSNTGITYIDSKGDLETQNRFPSPPSMNISHDDDFDLTIVHETPRNDDNALDHDYEPPIVKETPIKNSYPATLESVSESTIIQSKFSTRSFSPPCSTSASECMNTTTTPKKQQIPQNNSPLDSSVNSHFHKRRKSSAFASVKMARFDSSEPKPTFPVKETMNLGDETKKDLKISCSLCKNPLGLAENDYFVPCSTMSLSKVQLVSSWKGREKGGTSVAVVVSDISSVEGRIWKRNGDEGIWSKEDGCVFNTAFCSFCRDQDNCLGLHVVATDSSNVQLLNKVLFYSDRLEIQQIDTSTTNKEESLSSVTSLRKSVLQNPFEKFAYTSPQTNSIGWRTTKSKMRLPKKVQVSATKY